MKMITGTFWTCVAALAVTFGMSIYTAVAQSRAEAAHKPDPTTIPTPATLPH
jgi:hypothetical protein